jgi:hypothetical protein
MKTTDKTTGSHGTGTIPVDLSPHTPMMQQHARMT